MRGARSPSTIFFFFYVSPHIYDSERHGEGHGCAWMDARHNWSDPEFLDERGESPNPAIGIVWLL